MMNERIQTLAEQQAGSILMDLIMPDAGMPARVEWNVGCTTEHLKKFAELIVRECCQAVWSEECNTSDLALEEYKRTVRKIRHHFKLKNERTN